MALRSARERVVQTLWFEGVGLGLIAPLYAAFGGAGAGESFVMVAAVALVVMAWAALFNTAFDAVEWRLTGRVASARPQCLRLVHAVSFELTAMLVTVPVIHALGHMSWLQALQTDVTLTLAYMAYGYAFHRVYDHWRPVRTDVSGRPT
jgi:uncharacterized membrane protein